MSLELLETGASALGPLREEVVFVGGASLVLWITDPAAPSPRPTKDVDVIVEVADRWGYEQFSKRMRAQGFTEDAESRVICRWRHASFDLTLDAMPTDAGILGFSNRWQEAALPHALARQLPSGAVIKAITPPYLLATKLEAFAGRGGGDLIGSRDFEDVISLVDGRAALVKEVLASPGELRAFLAQQLVELRAISRFEEWVAASLRPDAASQARLEAIVLPRLEEIAASA
ncbi:MAG TPA: nucleotidyl transferase AbiEii/AbiGii toxin family protein [Solirubrobacteraceae bacterium]|nr:nucleotidyl transferase AbiEii/AbiGii toxin family protein [Solirubrobacteraceae bacterium]